MGQGTELPDGRSASNSEVSACAAYSAAISVKFNAMITKPVRYRLWQSRIFVDIFTRTVSRLDTKVVLHTAHAAHLS